jgi:hypothetical protein
LARRRDLSIRGPLLASPETARAASRREMLEGDSRESAPKKARRRLARIAFEKKVAPGTRWFRYRCSLPGLAGFTDVTSPGTINCARSSLVARGGEGGIRTLGTFQYTRFPIVHLRPLGHLSKESRRETRIKKLETDTFNHETRTRDPQSPQSRNPKHCGGGEIRTPEAFAYLISNQAPSTTRTPLQNVVLCFSLRSQCCP